MEVQVSLRKRFRGFSLELDASWRGPALFLGPNGSGKSTALRCMAGLYKCGGWVKIGGRPASEREFLYVPPAPRVPPTLTVEEYLNHVSEILDVDVKPVLGVDGFLKKRGSELSSGMAARVVLAAALSSGKALLLDEPLLYLETSARLELVRALRGRLFVAATHDPSLFIPLEPAVVQISEGRSAAVGSWASLKALVLRRCGGELCVGEEEPRAVAGYVV